MLVLVDLFEFEVIVASELGVASSHGVGGFQQIIAEETITRLDEPGVLGFEVAGLVLIPYESSELGDRGLGLKTMDIGDFSDDAGGVNLANAGNGCKGVMDDFKLLLNGLIQYLDLAFLGPHSCDRNRHGLVYGIVDCPG